MSAAEADVDRFLWEVERHLSHVDGDERLKLVREAERLLHEEAARIAGEEGDDDLTWVHYVQASAHLGPPEALAARLSGMPLPDLERSHRKAWTVVGAVAAFTLVIVAYAVLTQGDLQTVGAWSAREEDATRTHQLNFTVSAEADSVFLFVIVTPAMPDALAHVTILDGASDTVYAGTAAGGDRLELARYVEGAPGQWQAFLDLQDFTGAWQVKVRQEV